MQLSPTTLFIEHLECAGLTLSLRPDGTLSLAGPAEARTEPIRRYIRENKDALAEWLALKARIETRVKAALSDERAGLLPTSLPDGETLETPEGLPITNPAHTFAVAWRDADAFNKSNPAGWQRTQGGRRVLRVLIRIACWWHKQKGADNA